MTGLEALFIVMFTVGFIAGVLLVVAIGIVTEDRAASRRNVEDVRAGRRSQPIVLHQPSPTSLSRGVRRLTGAGQRGDRSRDPGDE
jgi:hypothetical protein